MVKVETASGKQTMFVRSGSSYCSQSELAVTFGLGKDTAVKALEIYWPSGTVQRLANVPLDRAVVVEEGKGLR